MQVLVELHHADCYIGYLRGGRLRRRYKCCCSHLVMIIDTDYMAIFIPACIRVRDTYYAQ